MDTEFMPNDHKEYKYASSWDSQRYLTPYKSKREM